MKERGESRRVKIYLCIKDKWSKLMIIIWICISSHFLKPHHPCIIIGFWYVKTSTPANWTNHFPFSYVFHVIFFMSSNLAYVPKLNDLCVAVDILLLFVVGRVFRSIYLIGNSLPIMRFLHGKLNTWSGYV